MEGDARITLRRRKPATQTAVRWAVSIPGTHGVRVRDAGPRPTRVHRISNVKVPATVELALREKHGLVTLECKYYLIILMFVYVFNILAFCVEVSVRMIQ